jgi:hypothetical protein
MGGVWSTHIEILFVSSLAWDGFKRGCVNTCCDSFFDFAGMRNVCSTHVEMHFLSSQARESFWLNVEIHFVSSLAINVEI